jgi:tetratricopeptide (TPR) repeat protein
MRLMVGLPLLVILAVALFFANRWLSERSGGPVQQALLDIERIATVDGDPQAALAAAETLVTEAPDEPEGWLWLGILHTVLDQPAEAQAAFERARALSESSVDFLVQRSLVSLRMGLLEDALASAEQAVAEAPDAAVAHLMLGNLYDVLGRRWEALQEFQTAADLADAAGQSELAVNARIRIGQLLMLGPEPLGTATPE